MGVYEQVVYTQGVSRGVTGVYTQVYTQGCT